MKQTKICLITDVHLTVEGEMANHIDTRNNFINVLKAVRDESPDHLIIGGDICFMNPEMEVYKWAKKVLDESGLEYSVISGNHDDSKMLHTYLHPELVFNEKNSELYYVKYISNIKFLFLDTAVGVMSEKQWAWLEEELMDSVNDINIIMHHPPVIAGVPHMDTRYSFKEMNRFQNLLLKFNQNINIYTGHYHVEKLIKIKNISVFITPSCFVQIDDKYLEFVADHYKIGYRNIIMGEDYFSTNVKYLL